MAAGHRPYVYGNTARQIKEDRRGRDFYVLPESPRDIARKQKKAHIARIYNAILVVGTVVALCVIIWHYINVQAEVTALMSRKATLQSQYEELRLDNDLYEDRINSSINIREIERIAVEELGMRLAREGQIINYSGEIEDYVKQYADMPE